ncbi:MAG: hypothetical protein N2578_00730 [Bdellovibrionaceae bacterium]|nr:hypothetical protein [Pseudobdellovibrionaceae bacterium]
MLIKEIDDFDRSPTEMDILALAKKYRETPDLVRIVFETKGDRASSLESPKKRQDAWLQEEVEIVTALKSNIREAVRRLNELDINKNRGVKRTRKSVELKLRRLGV